MKGEKFIRRLAYRRRRWPVELAIGAIFRNEAPYLREWIEFHQQQGVARFYLYENASTDDWRDVLRSYRDVIELQPWPIRPGQLPAYADCLRRHRWDTRWIAFLDLDEFLFSPTSRELPDVLREFDSVAAVAANWRCYGTSRHDTPQKSICDAFTFRAVDDHPENRHVKSIVFPMMTSTHVQNPHHFRHYGPAVGEKHDLVTTAYRTPPTVDLLRINHYVTRSTSELERKLATMRADQPQMRVRPELKPLNAIYDPILAERALTGLARSDSDIH